jgi:hypothetical protein
MLALLLTHNVVTTVNGKTGTAGVVSLAASDVGLGNVPNISPVASINSLNGALTLAAGTGLALSVVGNTLTLNIGALSLPWTSLSGDPLSNTALASALATVGVQTAPRTVTASGNFTSADLHSLWVNVDVSAAAVMTVPAGLGGVVGSMLEVRQGGAGPVSITSAAEVTLFVPYGAITNTQYLGQRIQLICTGVDSWEYR